MAAPALALYQQSTISLPYFSRMFKNHRKVWLLCFTFPVLYLKRQINILHDCSTFCLILFFKYRSEVELEPDPPLFSRLRLQSKREKERLRLHKTNRYLAYDAGLVPGTFEEQPCHENLLLIILGELGRGWPEKPSAVLYLGSQQTGTLQLHPPTATGSIRLNRFPARCQR